ncbi:MAG: endonuclease/exonuclease/phosphatase family protein [Phycisphaerales bacterium]|nr:endonuclease/exonuclease/phosphatase family protein [Phycisphaerales bacterium]
MQQVCAILVAALLGLHGAFADEPRVDGLFGEWTPSNVIATDPIGDASGAFDVQRVSATNRGTRLFLRFDITAIRNVQSGTAADGTLLVQIAMPAGRALTIDLRNRSLWRDNDEALSVGWDTVGYTTAPTYAANEFELVVDLASFGVVVGSPITINFSSSDTLAANVQYTMTQPAVVPVRRSAERATGSAFRIASVNTEQTGFLVSSRRTKLLRLVDGMNADIYCFQEEYNSTAAQLDTYLTGADPMEDGANWLVHKNNDCVIASRSPLLPLPSPNNSTACAVIDLPAAGTSDAVVVFSIHPKCCGYIGSSEDATRIAQMTSVVATLNDLRAGTLGAAFEPYRQAPAIIIGDWNLVGSITPLTMVRDAAGPNMRDAIPPHLIGEDVATWRGTSTTAGSFTPGRLDLLANSSVGLQLRGSFVLDTATLNATELAALGVQSGDSASTDHNMIVGDFGFGSAPTCAGDVNGDHQVNGVDIAVVLSNWGGVGGGDSNGDGVVNAVDVAEVLANFGGTCQ